MTRRQVPLRLYGREAETEQLAWSWVESQLEAAGTYWVTAPSSGCPHPRPVWGVWLGAALAVSVGSPGLHRQIVVDPNVTVHLDSGTDVVIVEGRALPVSDQDEGALEAYNAKYDWNYTIDEYGPLTLVAPVTVLAWRSAGWAGREGFRHGGRWTFS